MNSLNRNTRLKLSNNPTGELLKALTPCVKKKIAALLRAFRAAASLFIILLAASCSKEQILSPICEDGVCDAYMYTNYTMDSNGYTHVELDWSTSYLPYFYIDVEASRTSPSYHYNNVSSVSAEFDTDSYYVLGDSLAFTIPLYNSFSGLETYEGFPISVQDTTVYLSQFEGTVLPVVQNDTRVYFSESNDGRFTTRRTVGPIPEEFINDTITIFMRVFWDGGQNSMVKDHYLAKYIIE